VSGHALRHWTEGFPGITLDKMKHFVDTGKGPPLFAWGFRAVHGGEFSTKWRGARKSGGQRNDDASGKPDGAQRQLCTVSAQGHDREDLAG